LQLRTLTHFKELFPSAVLGLSDHTLGHTAVLGAVTLGAKAVEKHFTDDPSRVGPDHGFSMSPLEWREMVDETRRLEDALGTGRKQVEANEQETVVLQRRCLRAARPLSAGTKLIEADFVALRPAPVGSLPPYEMDRFIGQVLKYDKEQEDAFSTGDFL
jgi:N-acetylneuraminate synthase